MADWYVYQHDGDPLGPWSTDTVADAILAGRLAPDVWVAAPGGPRWLRALDVPVIGRLVEGIPTKPRRDSGLRLMPGVRTEATMLIIKDADLELAEQEETAPSSSEGAVTARLTPRNASAEETLQVHVPTRGIYTREDVIAFAADDDEPATDPAMPPLSSTPAPHYGDDAIALPEAPLAPAIERPRRRKNA